LNPIHIFWEHSPLWLLPVFLLSLGLAWYQYAGKQDWSNTLRYSLFGIRTLLLFFLGLLLLNPLLRMYRENKLPPVTVILADNSRSIKLGSNPDSLKAFSEGILRLKEKLEKEGSQVFIETLNGNLNKGQAIEFGNGTSDLESSLRRIKDEFENQNLAQVILASDGIVNQGSDLQDFYLPFKVHTIRLGNTSPGKDLKISDIRHNKIAYLGNSFPVSLGIKGTGLKNQQVTAKLYEGDQLIETKTVALSGSGMARAEFTVKPNSKGMKEFRVDIGQEDGEITLENNKRNFFIEVVSEKQKVLLLASCPHPDLKAIRNALSQMEQIELVSAIAGIDNIKPDNYNLVILHQLPDKLGSFSAQVSEFLKKGKNSLWVISTPFTDFNRLRLESASWLNIQGGNGQEEEAGNRFDQNFQGFLYEDKWKQTLSELPPVKSPGASFSWKGSSESILNQMIGRIATPTPLLSIQSGENAKRAIFWGDGIWLWRLNEFGKNENTEAVDNLIIKTCQLLLSAGKKKQLMVSSISDEYSESETVAFRVETFNQLMEPVYDKKVSIQIGKTGSSGKEFSMLTAPGNPLLRTQTLTTGAYHFSASSIVDGRTITDEGDFIVRAYDLEARDLEANHALLKSLSEKSGGISTGVSGMLSLANAGNLPPALIEFTDWNENLLSQFWLLMLLLTLLSTEWLLRKMNGIL
jgi:hypothetical protein